MDAFQVLHPSGKLNAMSVRYEAHHGTPRIQEAKQVNALMFKTPQNAVHQQVLFRVQFGRFNQ